MHINPDSEERITNSVSYEQTLDTIIVQNDIQPVMFDSLQQQWLAVLEEKYSDYRLSSRYFELYEILNLEVKQYVVLRKAGLIPNLEQ